MKCLPRNTITSRVECTTEVCRSQHSGVRGLMREQSLLLERAVVLTSAGAGDKQLTATSCRAVKTLVTFKVLNSRLEEQFDYSSSSG